MENTLSVFTYENQDVRVVEIDGAPWWVGKDVAEILGYGAGSAMANAVRKHVDDEDKGVTKLMTPGGMQKMTIVNESGLYALIIGSKLPTAKKFKHWVTSEVLPSIRKHGIYATEQVMDQIIADPDYGIRLLNNLKEERAARMEAERQKALLEAKAQEQQAEIEVMKPKAEYYDMVLKCPNMVSVTQIAKDYGMSAVAFNRMLKEMKIQYKSGRQWFLYQEYAKCGYAHGDTYFLPYSTSNKQYCSESTKWTQKGRLFLYEFLKKRNILPMCERE